MPPSRAAKQNATKKTSAAARRTRGFRGIFWKLAFSAFGVFLNSLLFAMVFRVFCCQRVSKGVLGLRICRARVFGLFLGFVGLGSRVSSARDV